MIVPTPFGAKLNRREALIGLGTAAFTLACPTTANAEAANASLQPWATKLITAARRQIGVTVEYDGSYVALAFPGGDVPRETGVCTDVIVRAYRDAFAFDLQRAVNADMKRHFRAYPRIWGLRRPDRNIDHRRVPNLQTFFKRRGGRVSDGQDPSLYRPGDMITQRVGGQRPHIGILGDRPASSGRLMLIHNIGGGTQEEDVAAVFPVTGHYRFDPTT